LKKIEFDLLTPGQTLKLRNPDFRLPEIVRRARRGRAGGEPRRPI